MTLTASDGAGRGDEAPYLGVRDIRVLRVLSEDGGFATADVSRLVGWGKSRKHSAVLSIRIRRLERHGFVGRMDDQKPIAWTRTAKGTAALAAVPPLPGAGGEG